MSKNLVIVESPAKAKTINKYLGSDYIVKSSIGHIRDLPKKSGELQFQVLSRTEVNNLTPKQKQAYQKNLKFERLYARMGIYPNKNWQAKYQIIDGKGKVVSELKSLAKKATTVYLATDLDREGEAIAWHIKEIIGQHNYKRVIFNEITKSAINKAFNKPTVVNDARVNAQQVRRFLDRIVGFMLSPLLWEKVARGLSAGRVQSVAVKLLVEQEQKIREFVPEEYWSINTDLNSKTYKTISFELAKKNNKKFVVANAEQAQLVVKQLKQANYVVDDISARDSKPSAPPPFITSTLQQVASIALGYGVKKTMMLAQRLYDAGHITYMRTDSTQLSADSIASVRKYIATNFSADYLPSKPIYYKGKQNSQEAHEAIRPSAVNVIPSKIKIADSGAQKLYNLIWRRFVACQMAAAQVKSTTVLVKAAEYQLKTSGKIIEFDGYQKVLQQTNKEQVILPSYKQGDSLQLQKISSKQHFTKGPSRYREASLVKELEKLGIGRPSTYASIISTVLERGYVRKENKALVAEKIAEIVTQRLSTCFPKLMSYDFTAKLEAKLDQIAENKKDWKKELTEFYKDFIKTLEAAETQMQNNSPTQATINCSKCQRQMQIRNAATGVFLGCSGYAETGDNQCKNTVTLTEYKVDASDNNEFALFLRNQKPCPICDKKMIQYFVDGKTMMHICTNNPDCSGHQLEEGDFAKQVGAYEGPTIDCDKCSSSMELKDGRFGKYFACTNAECKNTRKLLKNGQPAPPKMQPISMPELKCAKVADHFLLRDGAAGLFLAASKFPKYRESRAPKLSELRPHAKQLIEKYQYLLSGPDKSPDGDDIIIRFNKKSNQIYLRAENNQKATGWQAFYKDGSWQGLIAKPKKSKK